MDNVGDVSIPVGHFANIDLLNQFRPMPGAETTGITIMRTHCRVWVTSAAVVGDGIYTAFFVDDLGEVTANSTIGGLIHTDPVDNPYVSWMLYQRWNAHPGYSFTSPNNNFEFDIKSKRRVPFGSTLMLSLGNIDATLAVTFSYHSRALIALS